MPLSTLHSDARRGGLLVVLLFTALMAWLGAVTYTLWGNPEIRHFRATHELKRAWAERMTREHGSKVIVYGGSSCEFSIDGERMLERFGLACVNLGRGAGMGSTVLTMAALAEARPGDTLVVALEPALVTEELDTPHLGVQFSVAVGHWDWIRSPLPPAEPVSWPGMFVALRPGGYHTLTMLGKLVRGQELYRYKIEEMHPSGWNQTPVRLPLAGPPPHRVMIPEPKMAFLKSLAHWCETNRVRLAYALPWGFCPADKVDAFREDNARFLRQVAEAMPVLKDPRMGAYSEAGHFSDTVWHLTGEGAALRTDELGRQLREWDIWTKEELGALVGGLAGR